MYWAVQNFRAVQISHDTGRREILIWVRGYPHFFDFWVRGTPTFFTENIEFSAKTPILGGGGGKWKKKKGGGGGYKKLKQPEKNGGGGIAASCF